MKMKSKTAGEPHTLEFHLKNPESIKRLRASLLETSFSCAHTAKVFSEFAAQLSMAMDDEAGDFRQRAQKAKDAQGGR